MFSFTCLSHIVFTIHIVSFIQSATYQIISLDLNIPNHVFQVNTNNVQGTENLCLEVVEGSGSVYVDKVNVNQNLLGPSASNISSTSGNYPCLMNKIFPLTFDWSTYFVRVVPITTSTFLSYKFSYYSLANQKISQVLYSSSFLDNNPYIYGYSLPGEICSSDFLLKYTPVVNGIETTVSIYIKYINGSEKINNYTANGFNATQINIDIKNMDAISNWNFKLLYNTSASFSFLAPYKLQLQRVVNNTQQQSLCCQSKNFKYNSSNLKCSNQEYLNCSNLNNCLDNLCINSSSCSNLNCSVSSNCVYSKCSGSSFCQNYCLNLNNCLENLCINSSSCSNLNCSVSSNCVYSKCSNSSTCKLNNAPQANNQQNSSTLGAIIGGAIGGIILLVGLGFLIYCCIKKKKDNRQTQRYYAQYQQRQSIINQMIIPNARVSALNPNAVSSSNLIISESMTPYKMSSRNQPQYDDVDCAVCLDTGCNVSLKCGHSFHFKCIVDWLNRNNMCPCCRAEISKREQKKKQQPQASTQLSAQLQPLP